MASPCDILLTSSNYFSWKALMEDVLRSRGLFQITLGKGIQPIDVDKKIKLANKCDESHGLIKMLISTTLKFYLQEIDKLDTTWNNLETVFGKHNEI